MTVDQFTNNEPTNKNILLCQSVQKPHQYKKQHFLRISCFNSASIWMEILCFVAPDDTSRGVF